MTNEQRHVPLDELAALGRDVDDALTAERLTASAEAVMYYATQRRLADSGEDAETVLSDLLIDLMHLTVACGLPGDTFARLVERAEMHFEEERRNGR